MPKVAFDVQVGGWDFLSRSLKDKELPSIVEEQRQALEDAAKQAIALKVKHRRLHAATLATAEHLRETIARGQEAESRLRRFLKATYGTGNLELAKHGIQPHRRRRRPEPVNTAPGLKVEDVPPEGEQS
jgi:hypothetical protein